MPIKDGKYKNPNWVNGGPPAIDADELNAISSTLESLDAAGGTGGDGKRYARIVIGTSTNGWTAADCDYLCNGTADQEIFLEAINALPSSGGEIKVLDGTYNFSENVEVVPTVNSYSLSIVGCGKTTTINFSGTQFRYRNYGDGRSTEVYFKNIHLSGIQAGGIGNGLFSFYNTFMDNPVIGDDTYVGASIKDSVIEISKRTAPLIRAGVEGYPNEVLGNKIFISISGSYSVGPSTSNTTAYFANNYICASDNSQEKSVSIGDSSFSGNTLVNVNVVVDSGSATGNVITGGTITVLEGVASGNVVNGGQILCTAGSSVTGNRVAVSLSAEAGIYVYKSADEQNNSIAPNTISGNIVTGGACGILLSSPAPNIQDKSIGNTLIIGNSCDSSVPLQIESEWHDCLITGNMFPNGAIVDNGTNNTKTNNFTGT